MYYLTQQEELTIERFSVIGSTSILSVIRR